MAREIEEKETTPQESQVLSIALEGPYFTASALAKEAAMNTDAAEGPVPFTSLQENPTGLVLANLRTPAGPRLVARTSKGLLALTEAARDLNLAVPSTTDEVIAGGEGSLRECLARASDPSQSRWFVDEQTAAFAPCVTRPGKIVCVGLNYRRHAREIGMPEPKVPVLFAKFANALTHHRAVVPTAGLAGRQFDYECELVIVIGRRAVRVTEQAALSHVFGYCTGNDVSERSAQLAGGQWLAGKTSDGFAPIGPWLVGSSLVGDPNRLAIRTRVNGELRQDSSTADFIFNCQQLIAYCSALFPLEPGDIIYTGTPEGVVLGMPKERQTWLVPGDVVTTAIEGLGTLQVTLGD
jgi:2-keto-4-pentenoate hydratase/2-oxohepta-3-ene-1,7-dioic acid hydratase in catechol pathway